MQLNQTTNHAIRIILLLTKSNAVVSSNTIAEKTNLSRRYLFRITSRLRDAGLISVTRGPEGGYELQKPPAEISVYDILHTLEGPILLPEYGEDQNRHAALSAVYSFFKDFFDKTTQLITFDKLSAYSDTEIRELIHDFVLEEKTQLFT